MNLPPVLRQIQQSKLFHIVAGPVLSAVGVTVWECIGHHVLNLSLACLRQGFSHGLDAIVPITVLYYAAVFSHSPGSASFHADGSPNEAVAQAASNG